MISWTLNNKNSIWYEILGFARKYWAALLVVFIVVLLFLIAIIHCLYRCCMALLERRRRVDIHNKRRSSLTGHRGVYRLNDRIRAELYEQHTPNLGFFSFWKTIVTYENEFKVGDRKGLGFLIGAHFKMKNAVCHKIFYSCLP